jgi:hypothetical protein
VDYRYTRHQVARGARPDAADGGSWVLLKWVSELHLTYQIRLLTFAAAQERARLTIKVPKRCRLSPPLSEFLKQHKRLVKLQRVDG